MANIADNLTRLLGTTGYNIQEILENTDSLGGGSVSIPLIEFVGVEDVPGTYSYGEVKGIDDVTNYAGVVHIKLTSPTGDSLGTFIGNAMPDRANEQTRYMILVPDESSPSNLSIACLTFFAGSELNCMIKTISMS